MPRRASGRDFSGLGLDDFAAQHFRAAQVGSQAGLPAFDGGAGGGIGEGEAEAVADEPAKAVARGGFHDWRQFFHDALSDQLRDNRREGS